MHGAGDAVFELVVELRNLELIVNRSLFDIVKRCIIDHISDVVPLDGFIFRTAPEAVLATDVCCVSSVTLCPSVVSPLDGHHLLGEKKEKNTGRAQEDKYESRRKKCEKRPGCYLIPLTLFLLLLLLSSLYLYLVYGVFEEHRGNHCREKHSNQHNRPVVIVVWPWVLLSNPLGPPRV